MKRRQKSSERKRERERRAHFGTISQSQAAKRERCTKSPATTLPLNFVWEMGHFYSDVLKRTLSDVVFRVKLPFFFVWIFH